jgi:cytidyltransferase-like protein
LFLLTVAFDIIHPGHIGYLEAARKCGDFLIVALTLDQYVGKPGRPIHKWEDRATTLRWGRCVDMVVPSATGTDAILKWRPQVFAKGMDYTLDTIPQDVRDACNLIGAEILFLGPPKRDIRKLVMEQSA